MADPLYTASVSLVSNYTPRAAAPTWREDRRKGVEKGAESDGRRGGGRGWGNSALASVKVGGSPGSNLELLKMVAFMLSGV